MTMIHIGCSGWNYRHWRGRFYPAELPVKRWFAHYATVFDTVEINNSFYRLPTAETFAAWRDQAPEGFRYAVKAGRFLTHQKKLKDAAEPLARFLDRARHLDDRLGPILYQLPPRWQFDRDRLLNFLDLLPRDLQHVFEFREPSWMTDEVLALLDERSISFCTHDIADLAVPRRATGPIVYVRFHGPSGRYYGRYDETVLEGCWRRMESEAARGRDIYAYFNNDIDDTAITDALTLKRITAQARSIRAA